MKAIPPDLALEYNKNYNEKQSQITDSTAYLRREVESRERTEYLVKPHDSQLKINNSYSNSCKNPKTQICSKVEVRLRNVLKGEETVIEASEIEEISKATAYLIQMRGQKWSQKGLR
ncbi:integrase catalytic domain-containing protein [Trichonephila inaurata madagascariensis]|uniref:Integrase catalytic domain-containing protein n=1 Tax=Trichonephila inaurata madagascariensis TaxID=2747483 RepID=A0A8X6X6M5_9ARAC|nr:integrase catalytic domain-containing protein [Trichonephila inaurata madagascariensis]